MHIKDVLGQPGPHFSFEFFPPKSENDADQLFQSIKDLSPINPAFVSVTYGAGGRTRHLTRDLVIRLQRETALTVVAHITAVGASRAEIHELLEDYSQAGIENLLVLRGDPPKGDSTFVPAADGFHYASEIISYVKKNFPHIGMGVAGFPEGHPETPNRLQEIDYLKAKIDSGADYICTQLFFDNRDFYDFCERCRLAGITVPIVAGIMPITSRHGMARMAGLALGARFPARLQRAISRAENDLAVERIGLHWATEQVFDLYDNGVDGIHFYTLNRSKPTLRIYEVLDRSPHLPSAA
ncbi:MAG: methylenetetrahydrofolate reductase [NAD(P)H] [Caldilineales bacterium]